MFSLIGKGYKAGSGFDVFRDSAKYAGTAGPELEERLDPDRTKLMLHVQTDGSKLLDHGAVSHGASDVSDGQDLPIDAADVGETGKNVGQAKTNVGKTRNNVGKIETNVGKADVGQDNGNTTDGRAARAARTVAAVLECIKADNKATAEAIAGQIGISERQVERAIKKLRESGRQGYFYLAGSPNGDDSDRSVSLRAAGDRRVLLVD